MHLRKEELALCLGARGYTDVPGFGEAEIERMQRKQQEIRRHLMENGLVEPGDSSETGYRFSALGQVILDTVGAPEVWLEVRNGRAGIHRRLYLRDAYYVCADEDRQMLHIMLLPSLPMMIGGYASALAGLAYTEQMDDEQLQKAGEAMTPFIQISACCGESKLELEIGDQGVARKTTDGETIVTRFSEETCTNGITLWMLEHLQERRKDRGE